MCKSFITVLDVDVHDLLAIMSAVLPMVITATMLTEAGGL